MAKTKPVRLIQEIMRSATIAAKKAIRTPKEQIEHLPLLGKEAK